MNMQTLESKQQYLRQNIPQDQYEQFLNFVQDRVGNLNIEDWSSTFIKQIVQAFADEKLKLPQHQTSFYIYQIKENQNNNQQGNNRQDLNTSKAQTSNLSFSNKSAMNLFDSVFQKNQKFSTNLPKQDLQVKSNKDKNNVLPNLIQPSEFWSSSGVVNKPVNKNAKSNMDFTTFDFWSQPQPKTNKQIKPTAVQSTKSVASKPIPSFDDLLKDVKPPKQQKAPSPYLKKSYPEQKGKTTTTAIKVNKVIYDGQAILKDDFKEVVKCMSAGQRQSLKDKDLHITIESHQIVSRTFLMPDYVMYFVKVQPLNIVIKRNYQDFTRLRQTLSDFYPGIKLAYLEKNSWFSATSIQNIKRQKKILQFFLNDLIKNKEILNSRIFQEFITLQEHKKIKRKFEQYQKLQKPKSIEELCLLQPQININLSQNQRLYQQNLKKYQQKIIQFLNRFQNLNQVLSQQYQAMTETIQDLIKLSTSVMQQTHKFNQRVYGLQFQHIQEIFNLIKSSLIQEKKVATFNSELIANTVLPFLNYQKYNIKELDELINLQQSFFRSYLKRNQIEKIDPSIPYTSDKIKNAKVSIQQQSKNMLVLKYQVGYFSNQLCNEAKRTYETLAMKFRQLCRVNFMRKQQETMKSLQYWKNVCENSKSLGKC